MIDKSDSMSF